MIKQTTNRTIAQFLRSIRKHLKLSQEKFAARLGITFPTISRWENRRAKPSPLGWEQVRTLVEEINQDIVITLFPRVEQKRPEPGKKTLAEKVLDALKNGPLSTLEIAENLGHKSISGGLRKILRKLLDSGKINLTIPDKKESRLQKYILKKTTINHLPKL